MNEIKKWITDNSLNVIWKSDRTFTLDNKNYFCLPPKSGKIIDEEFHLIKTEEESYESLLGENPCDYYCFSFGSRVYYTASANDKLEFNLLKHIGQAKDLSGFTYLGIHGGYEIGNGSRDYNDWCKKASFLGIQALGVCDRHTLAGTLKFQLACQQAKIKPLIGETFLVKKSDKEKYQIKVYCTSNDGWQSLLYLNSLVNVFNEEKCLSIDQLKGLPDLIVVLGEVDLNDELVTDFYDIALDNVYYQLDPVFFNSVERDKKKLEIFKNYFKNYRDILPPVLICDSYYLDKEDSHIKKILNKIAGITPDYYSEDQYFKPLEHAIDQLDVMFTRMEEDGKLQLYADAISNLDKIVNAANFSIEIGRLKLPKYILTEEEKSAGFNTSEDIIWDLLLKGFDEKITKKGKDEQLYMNRLELEMKVISKGGFIDYFMILAELGNWCKSQGILTGMGRGSAAGSLVAYCLDLTRLDPIPLDLLFERFLDESRLTESAPDIDSDFPRSRRDDVKRYLEQRYGADNVCSIGTYGTFKARSGLRDLCRLEGVPPQTINYHAAMIEDNGYDVSSKQEYSYLFRDAVGSPALKKFITENSKVAQDIELIIGQAKNTSVHPSGVIITPSENGETIFNWMPVKKVDGVLISEWEGTELDTGGFLKEDILGIAQLDKFQDIFNLIEKNGGKHPEYEGIDYDDQKVLELFRRGWNEDLFHFGSQGLTAYCRAVKPDSMNELIAIIALFRPGVIKFGTHEDYIKIKHGKKELKYDWGCEKITEPTYSLLVYQEQVMRICQAVGGLSMLDANKVRKGMSKQILAKILPFKEKFIKGATEKGCPMAEAAKIWNKMEAFAVYSFNKCISEDETIYRAGSHINGKSNYKPTIGEMYKIKNSREYAKSTKHIALHNRYKRLGYGTAFSLNEENKLIKNRIVDIRFEGIREVFRITLACGRTIETTDNHKYPTQLVEKRLDELVVGIDKLFINLGYKQEDTMARFNTGENNSPVKGQQGFQTRDTSFTRFIQYREEKLAENKVCEECSKSHRRLEVHHRDGNHLNNNDEKSNLKVLCPSCHKKAEYKLGRTKMGEKGLKTDLSLITSIELVGKREVYDVEMAAPYHTFVTNSGIVTCNSHAAAYARTGYFCQYLKYYHPMEYWTVSLQYAPEDEIPNRIQEIRKLSSMLGEIKLMPPDINKSQKIFTSDFETNTIYWSLGKIKFAGETAVNAIIEEREKNGQFFSLEEFYNRIPKRTVNKRVLVNLILTGCFDVLHYIEVPQQRRELLREFFVLAGEKLPIEYENNDEFFWFSKQREVSGSGYFDYYKLIQISTLDNATARYLTPDKVLLPDNVDTEAVVAGVLVEIILKKSKKGEFAQLILDHNSEKVEVTVWSDTWERYADVLNSSVNKALLIYGQVRDDRYRKYQIIHTLDRTEIEVY